MATGIDYQSLIVGGFVGLGLLRGIFIVAEWIDQHKRR